MPPLRLAALAVVLLAGGCKKRVVTPAQCEDLVDHYAGLVVREAMPDASAEAIDKERAREKDEARAAGVFKNCASQIAPADYECAMQATAPEEVERCLE